MGLGVSPQPSPVSSSHGTFEGLLQIKAGYLFFVNNVVVCGGEFPFFSGLSARGADQSQTGATPARSATACGPAAFFDSGGACLYAERLNQKASAQVRYKTTGGPPAVFEKRPLILRTPAQVPLQYSCPVLKQPFDQCMLTS